MIKTLVNQGIALEQARRFNTCRLHDPAPTTLKPAIQLIGRKTIKGTMLNETKYYIRSNEQQMHFNYSTFKITELAY